MNKPHSDFNTYITKAQENNFEMIKLLLETQKDMSKKIDILSKNSDIDNERLKALEGSKAITAEKSIDKNRKAITYAVFMFILGVGGTTVFFLRDQLPVSIPDFVTGAILAYVLYSSKSIWRYLKKVAQE